MFSVAAISYSQSRDSIQGLHEVIIITPKKDVRAFHAKPLSTIEEYLTQSANINMIRRGAYAWEPMINSMPSERTLVTIEGMHIFGACTDKMDPITSYVEVSNLAEASVTSGQHGGSFGATIGGAINLVRNRSGFGAKRWNTAISSGYETNGKQIIMGSALNYSSPTFFIDSDVMYRNSQNYEAGNGQEVQYSQFNKINVSATAGVRLAENKSVEASVIYDKATDVGYPALPMDVALAEAVIASAKYDLKPLSGSISKWESKLYFNSVTHIMDDTQRTNVPIHMDMPGRSTTYGGYSSVVAQQKKHHLKINLNAFYNISAAEMTMYPENPAENLMFMLTWPDVHTIFSGLSIEDHYQFRPDAALKVTASAGLHSNSVTSDFGLQSMKIFYPQMQETNVRMLKSLAASLIIKKTVDYSIGLGYGERAPSVSEGYGYYLFNSFDNFDYVGNPTLNNEKSFEANLSAGFRNDKLAIKLVSAFFHITDYIVGTPELSLSPMTIGAQGVKLYGALPFANMINTNAEFEYLISNLVSMRTVLTYSNGRDNTGGSLPFISPFGYLTSLRYRKDNFSADLQLQGNLQQSSYAARYGEDHTPAYAVLNAHAGYLFELKNSRLQSKIGIENMLDAHYSTFGDWNNIPRKGRNLYLNLVFRS